MYAMFGAYPIFQEGYDVPVIKSPNDVFLKFIQTNFGNDKNCYE